LRQERSGWCAAGWRFGGEGAVLSDHELPELSGVNLRTAVSAKADSSFATVHLSAIFSEILDAIQKSEKPLTSLPSLMNLPADESMKKTEKSAVSAGFRMLF
jgi:hypothetical protein